MKSLLTSVHAFLQKHLHPHVHVSLKYASGLGMLGISLMLGLVLINPAFFSASLIQERIFEEQGEDFITVSEDFSGILPDSPLYALEEVFHGTPTKEDVMVLFAKVVKAAQKDEVVADEAYTEFLKALLNFTGEEQKEILESIALNLKSVSLENNVFPQAFDLFTLLQEESFWVNKLAEYAENDPSYSLLNNRTEIVFAALENNYTVEALFKNTELTENLFAIKQAVEFPNIDGETFHAAPVEWMEESTLWNALR